MARGSALNCQFASQVTATSLTVLLSEYLFTVIRMIVNNTVMNFITLAFDVNVLAINHLCNLDKASLCNFETSPLEHYGAT